MAVTVMNLLTAGKQVYTCTPREAVVAAYAQSLGDWNTWDYEKRYDHLVKEGEFTLFIEDFSVYKNGLEF